MIAKQAQLRTETCNFCYKPFSYKAKDYIRREFPFTCVPCIQTYVCRPNPAEKHLLTVYKHGHANCGKKTKTYRLWSSIHERCNNPNVKAYKFYGGKGLTVCDRWKDFTVFKNDIEVRGYKEGYSIIRKDKTLGYFPDNIKIHGGKGSAKYHAYRGNHYTLGQLHKMSTNGIALRGLQKRLLTGSSIEDAIHKPLHKNKPFNQRELTHIEE